MPPQEKPSARSVEQAMAEGIFALATRLYDEAKAHGMDGLPYATGIINALTHALATNVATVVYGSMARKLYPPVPLEQVAEMQRGFAAGITQTVESLVAAEVRRLRDDNGFTGAGGKVGRA